VCVCVCAYDLRVCVLTGANIVDELTFLTRANLRVVRLDRRNQLEFVCVPHLDFLVLAGGKEVVGARHELLGYRVQGLGFRV